MVTYDLVDLKRPVTEQDHSLGPPGATVELVIYVDYECPACLNCDEVVVQLRQLFNDRLRVVMRHFPQHSVHPFSSAAAQAAEAAGAQGKFWEMHRALIANQQHLEQVDFTHLALQLGLDPYAFERDLESKVMPRRVREDHDGGIRSGVRQTPTMFINGKRHDGPNDFSTLVSLVSAELA